MRIAFFILGAFLFCGISFVESFPKELTASEMECFERQIYLNECSGRPENLIHWRSDEDFPSFGVGHFIWYPSDKRGPFQESFPELILFLKEKGVEVPVWLEQGMPWRDREEFKKDLLSERMIALRSLLEQTKGLQTQFIVKRMEHVLPKMLEAAPTERRLFIEKKFNSVAETPKGVFAMIDYVNFKGEGISIAERLEGQGWGLLQVLDEMNIPDDNTKALEEFVHAAERVLEKRVKGVFAKKDETPVLKGWKNRVRSYLKNTC